jgi:hypothetical protein
MKQALIALVVVVVLGATTAASGARSLSQRQIAFWDRVADCEEHGAWWQGGGTYVGGLGIWSGNWWGWAPQVGDHTPASSTRRIDQMRVAQWGYENVRAFWGCFRVTGYPIVE